MKSIDVCPWFPSPKTHTAGDIGEEVKGLFHVAAMCLQISALGFLPELLSKILKAEIRIKTKTNTGSQVALTLLAHLTLDFLTRCSTHNQLTHILGANHLYKGFAGPSS